MVARVTAVMAAVVFVALLVPALFSSGFSSVSIGVLGTAALVGGLALSRSDARAATRAGAIIAIVGGVVLTFGVGLFALLYLGAFRGY
jgi:hypothetical protein